MLAAFTLAVTAILAYRIFGLIMLYIADCYPPAIILAEEGPSAAEVSALLEEARRITGELT